MKLENQTNQEFAATLLVLANIYGATPEPRVECAKCGGERYVEGERCAECINAPEPATLPKPFLTLFANSKEEVIAVVRAIGGKFTKREGWGGDVLYFESERIPGVSVHVDRDKVCRKIPARYECEPLLSPSDEAEILEVASA